MVSVSLVVLVLSGLLLVQGTAGLHKTLLNTSEKSPGLKLLEAKLRPLNILMVAAWFPGHLFPLVGLGETLIQRGHNVTLCSTVMQGSKILPKLAERVGVKFVSAGNDNLSQKAYEDMIREFGVNSIDLELFYRFMGAINPTNLKVKNQVEMLGASQYDLIISDINALPVGVYFAKLGMKSVIFSSFIPPLPAIRPQWSGPMSPLDQTDDLSFLERLLNVIVRPILLSQFRRSYEGVCDLDQNFSKVLGTENLLSYPGIRLPLIFTSVLGFDFPKTLTPLTHYVGPVLLSSSPDLGDSLKEWLSVRGEKSVVYISMGTTGYISKDMARSLVKGIMATKYDAVWALRMTNRDILEGIEMDPNRFYLADWVPQQTVLKHPSVSLTILHCGMNSVQESLYNGLPMVCMPYSFDHYEMSARVQGAGVGVSIYSYYHTLFRGKSFSPETMTEAIKSVDTPYAREQAKKIQLMYYFSGGTHRAAELLEFYQLVGYSHLYSAPVKYNWTWIQYYDIDVYCVLCVTVCLVLYILVKLLGRCFTLEAKPKLE